MRKERHVREGDEGCMRDPALGNGCGAGPLEQDGADRDGGEELVKPKINFDFISNDNQKNKGETK